MIRFIIKLFSLLSFFLVALLLSCTPINQNIRESTNQVLKIAEEKHFIRENIQTSFFKLATFSHITSKNDLLIIYLEGDGHSRNSKYELSTNPTPYKPLALQLALADPRPNIVYISRPGQYPPTNHPLCDSKYWSSHRFSPEVIDAINITIDHFKNQLKNKNTKVQLIGFSGGGGLAVLAAAHRCDVKSIITIAGDLDLVAMSAYHQTAPLKGSLNPLDFATRLKHIPQTHLIGKKDKIVPPSIANSYLKATRDFEGKESTKVQVQLIDAGHNMGWLEKWPDLILSTSYEKPSSVNNKEENLISGSGESVAN